jgi:outer membrane protein assembly factor BamB
MKQAMRGWRLGLAAMLPVVVSTVLIGVAYPASAVSSADWPAYLDGPAHSSFNAADTAITPSNVASLVKKWRFKGDPKTMTGQPGPGLFSSPTVADGAVYIGANTGWFYKLNEATGAVMAMVFLGYQPKLTCAARGFVSTATVAVDPSDGQDTVYVGAPDGYLYAMRASDLSLKWRSVIDIPSTTVSDYFEWSSPTVANGKIYIGSASHCDNPLTRGALVGYDQATGQEFARFFTVPSGILGGGIWSSAAVDSSGFVYVSTGTQPKNTKQRYYSVSLVKLDPNTLQPLAWFTVPNSQLHGDGDFGASPVTWTATINGVSTPMVGACNKNGIFYALDQSTMTVAWEEMIGTPNTTASPRAQCSAAPIYDGTSLYAASNPTTINGVSYRGSIRRLDPGTGAALWQTGLPNSVIGSPTMNGGGVIAVGTYDSTATPNAVYLVDASTGTIIRTLTTGGSTFAQSVFADGMLFTANVNGTLTAWGL